MQCWAKVLWRRRSAWRPWRSSRPSTVTSRTTGPTSSSCWRPRRPTRTAVRLPRKRIVCGTTFTMSCWPTWTTRTCLGCSRCCCGPRAEAAYCSGTTTRTSIHYSITITSRTPTTSECSGKEWRRPWPSARPQPWSGSALGSTPGRFPVAKPSNNSPTSIGSAWYASTPWPYTTCRVNNLNILV